MHRPTPMLCLICPPATGETTCVLREAGQRQIWQRVCLDSHQLDYHCLADLWPGWQVWHHEGRYFSDRTLLHLNWLMSQPEPAPLELPG